VCKENFSEHYLRRERPAEPGDTRIPCLCPHIAALIRRRYSVNFYTL
jgi:hypothetical protein